MPTPRFSIRSMVLFTAAFACAFVLNRIPWPEYALYNFASPLPEDQCFSFPFVVEYGIPLTFRTDTHAPHPRHEIGPCKFDATYHPVGIIVNLLFAVIGSTLVTAGLVFVPRFIGWQIYLAREREMIDVAMAHACPNVQEQRG